MLVAASHYFLFLWSVLSTEWFFQCMLALLCRPATNSIGCFNLIGCLCFSTAQSHHFFHQKFNWQFGCSIVVQLIFIVGASAPSPFCCSILMMPIHSFIWASLSWGHFFIQPLLSIPDVHLSIPYLNLTKWLLTPGAARGRTWCLIYC